MGNYVVDPSSGFVVDEETGEVVGRVVSLGPEWRSVDGVGRVRASRISRGVHDDGLYTVVPGRLGRLNESLRISDPALVQLLREVWRLGGVEALPKSVVEDAALLARKLYRRAGRRKVRRFVREVALACLITASRLRGFPKTLSDAEKHGADRRTVWSFMKQLALHLGVRIPPISPQTLVDNLAQRLGLPPDAVSLARRIAAAAVAKGIVEGRSPLIIAAASLYIAARLANIRIGCSSFGLAPPAVRRAILDLLDGLEIVVAV